MRSTTVRPVVCLCTIGVVVMSVAVTGVYSQSRARGPSRGQSRAGWQQGQMMQSQAGQPDFARRMAERNARNMQEMQQDMEQMQRWAEENRNRSIRQALRATDDQWRQIKPKLDRIARLKAEADVAAAPGSSGGTGGVGGFQGQGFMFGGGFGGGSGMGSGPVDILDPNGSASSQGDGWGGSWTTGPKSIMEMTEGETLCQELQHLLQGENASSPQIVQKVAALRKIRAQAREDLIKTRQELRGLMLPHQEPALVVMGYLD